MFTKQNLLATLAATVTTFVLGFLIWGLATADFFESHSLNNIMKDPPNFLILVIGNLIGSFALSSLYGKWARGHHSAKEGLEFGAWVGVFVGFGLGLVWYATSELMDITGQVVNGIIEIVFNAIIGMVIALVYKATAAKKELA